MRIPVTCNILIGAAQPARGGLATDRPSHKTHPLLTAPLPCRRRRHLQLQDNICTGGLQTTAGSRALHGYAPAFDATSVARLRAAGAVLVGKTNMDEFGMGSTTENSAYKVRRNEKTKHKVCFG